MHCYDTTDTRSSVVERSTGSTTAPATSTPIDPGLVTTILLADDDADIRDLVEHHLNKAGYRVLIAEDGAQVFEILAQTRPALMLLDVDMPRVSGFDVCRRLSADPDWRDVPVIFLTALSQTSDVVRGFEVGGSDYVCKPVMGPELLARVRTHVALAQSRALARKRTEILESVTQEQGRCLEDMRVGQEQLLTDPRSFPDLQIEVDFRPAHVAGGDFYEIKRLSDDDIAFFVADVSGHDLSMAFVTGALKALTASFLNEALSPEESMIQLNASLVRFLACGRYVSACYARFSQSRMMIDVISAGHPYPIFQRSGEMSSFVPLVGDVLGVFDTVRFQTQQLSVRAGDRLYLYTDGLTEGFADESGGKRSALHGLMRLRSCLDDLHSMPLQTVVHQVTDQVVSACGRVEDDIVVMGIEF